MDDEHMQRRQAEKDEAVADVWAVIAVLESERRQPDPWERICLSRALAALFSGCYSLAMVEARMAQTPPNERSPMASLTMDPVIARMDVALARRALALAQGEPVRRFPHLGPVEIV